MSRTALHVLVPEPPGALGGADLHVIDLARSQQVLGASASVFEYGSAEFARRVAAARLDVSSATGAHFAGAVERLAHAVATVQPGVVHAHGYDADYLAAAVRLRHPALFRQRPLIFTQHGVVEDTLWHRAKTMLDAICTRLADGVILCNSKLECRVRRWLSRGVVEYIPNGVEPPILPDREVARSRLMDRYGIPPRVPLVGYVGRLSAEKRPDLALATLARYRADVGVPAHLILAGSGDMRAELEKRCTELGIADMVTFAGLVHDIGLVYAGLDVLLLLSDTEGTPRTVVEALLSQVPVVATDVGSLDELLDHGRAGILVPRRDVQAAVRALAEVLSGRWPGPATRQWAAQRYGADRMAAHTLDFYGRVQEWVSRGRPSR